MKKIAAAAAAVALTASLAACSSDDTTDAAPSSAPMPSEDVAFQEENLVVVAGNVVTTVNNAREYDFTGDEASDGGVYDVASYYDKMTPDCKTKTTRSDFRKDFIDRVAPLVSDHEPERITVTVDPEKYTAVAKVEQTSGRTLVMDFDVEGTGEEFTCDDKGMISITATGAPAESSSSPKSSPRPSAVPAEVTETATVTVTPPAEQPAAPPAPQTSRDFPAEWDKDGNGLIDTDAPIG